MAYLTIRKCPKCGDVGERVIDICNLCFKEEEDKKKRTKEEEIQDLKYLTVDERLERIERWIQSHRDVSHYVPPRKYE